MRCAEARPGESCLALRRESLRPVDYNYHVQPSAQRKRRKIPQRDASGVGCPTSTWQPGEEIIDRWRLPVGSYTAPSASTIRSAGNDSRSAPARRDYAIELGPVYLGTRSGLMNRIWTWWNVNK